MTNRRRVTDGGSSRTDTREEPREDERRDEDRRGREPRREGPAEWFATSAVRIGVAIVALVLLLFAVGRIADVPLLSTIGDVLDSEIGVWLIVALFALLLLGLAARGFSRRRRR